MFSTCQRFVNRAVFSTNKNQTNQLFFTSLRMVQSKVIGNLHKLNDGNSIPMIGFGSSRIKGNESMSNSVEAALKAGYRLFDTAHIYENEEELGKALKEHLCPLGLKREDIFITTKMPTCDENTLENVQKHLQESLTKLQTDYLDLVLVHYPRNRFSGGCDKNHEVNKKGRQTVWKFLEEQKEKGVIKSIGVSNFMVYHLVELKEYAKVTPAVNQVEFHPYLTQDHVRQYCKENNIFVQAFSSLCWGNKEVLNEKIVQDLSRKYNVTPQTVLFAFATSLGVGVIPKSVTPSRILDNLKLTANIMFTPEESEELLALDRNLAFCPGCQPWKCL